MTFYNKNEYKEEPMLPLKKCNKKNSGEQGVRMPRQISSYTERGEKKRNKEKKRRFIKPSKPEGYTIYTHRNICNSLDNEYKTEWYTNYEFAYYCKDETGSNWENFLDPPPCV